MPSPPRQVFPSTVYGARRWSPAESRPSRRSAIVDGGPGLDRYKIAPFQPLAPMLAQPADDIEDAMERLGTAALEWKLDGARVQAHKEGDEVRLYSRTGNDVTVAAPEIVRVVRNAAARTLILDGEAIALKPDATPYPFQETMSRFGRVLDIDAMQASMPLSVFFFDCLRRDDDDLVPLATSARFESLAAALPSDVLTPRLVTGDAAAARAFYDEAVARGHEGIMVKALDAPYDPGARSAAWLKVKRSHTLDLVVLAAEWGHGRRRGWLSNLHLGALDPVERAIRDARQDLQGHDRRDAGVADRGDFETRDRARRLDRARAPGARRRDDVQRPAGEPALSGRARASFCARQRVPPGQAASEADTMETVRAIFAAQQRRACCSDGSIA